MIIVPEVIGNRSPNYQPVYTWSMLSLASRSDIENIK